LNQLWSDLKEIAGVEVDANYGPPRQGDVRDSLADISKGRKLLDYQPKFSVKEGLKITWGRFS